MKPQPAPELHGNTDWERLDHAVRKVFSVSKDVILKEQARLKKLRAKKQAKKQNHV